MVCNRYRQMPRWLHQTGDFVTSGHKERAVGSEIFKKRLLSNNPAEKLTFSVVRQCEQYLYVFLDIDNKLLDRSRHEQASCVFSDDLHLKHVVHEGDPVVVPLHFPDRT